MDNTDLVLDNSRYHAQPHSIIYCITSYCSILDFEALNADGLSPGNTLYSISDRPSPKASSSMTSVSTSECENVPLTNKSRVKRKKAKPEVEQSLYSYFSSPVASPRSSHHDTSVIDRQEQTLPTGNLMFITHVSYP